ncbi:MAG: hypothetical protein E7061_06620 [Treponema sp.]|nr:hypothetical protein [Treponema sp.]
MMNQNSLLKKIEDYVSLDKLPDDRTAMEELDEAVSVLENETAFYRPVKRNGKCGALLDFTKNTLPVILVPDLHGRKDFLLNLLKLDVSSLKKTGAFDGTAFSSAGCRVADLLAEKEIIVVCVGDGIHSEKRGRMRWMQAYEDWKCSAAAGPSMQEEMKENIATMRAVMELKKSFPENFHFLKGNHENILNSSENGNLPFYKYANEGQMTCDFIRQVYGDAVLYLISLWEKNLPLCCAFKDFCVSHAEPGKFYTRKKIIEGSGEVVHSFTWTDNDAADEGCVQKLFKELTGLDKEKALWFGGHRPVRDKFYLRQNGSYVQFHNPEKMNVAVVGRASDFDPEKSIISVI